MNRRNWKEVNLISNMFLFYYFMLYLTCAYFAYSERFYLSFIVEAQIGIYEQNETDGYRK